MKNFTKEVKISLNSEPSRVATYLLYMLEEGYHVEASYLGNSAATLLKAVCLLSNINNDRIKVSYHPYMEYVKDSYGDTRSATKIKIILL